MVYLFARGDAAEFLGEVEKEGDRVLFPCLRLRRFLYYSQTFNVAANVDAAVVA